MKSLRSVLPFAPGLLALCLCLTGTLSAADDPLPKKEKAPTRAELKKYDANGDGRLDEAETARMKADEKARREAKRAEELSKYDANRDGKLEKDEKAKMKADREAARAERKAEREAEKDAKDAERK